MNFFEVNKTSLNWCYTSIGDTRTPPNSPQGTFWAYQKKKICSRIHAFIMHVIEPSITRRWEYDNRIQHSRFTCKYELWWCDCMRLHAKCMFSCIYTKIRIKPECINNFHFRHRVSSPFFMLYPIIYNINWCDVIKTFKMTSWDVKDWSWNENFLRNNRMYTFYIAFCSKFTAEFSGAIEIFKNGHFNQFWPPHMVRSGQKIVFLEKL